MQKHNNKNDFFYTKSLFHHYDRLNPDDVIGKGFFPYDYIDGIERLNEPHLPSRENFYNFLTQSNITEEQYAFAQKMFNDMECKNIRDYLMCYLRGDVGLLADVQEAHREAIFDEYGLDPAWYPTCPSLSFASMLKATRSSFACLQDIELFRLCQKGITGGCVLMNTRYIKSNMPDFPGYDEGERGTQILMMDVVSLYASTMLKKLPAHSYERLTESEITSLSENNFEFFRNFQVPDINMILEVDFHIPRHLHDYFRDFPPGGVKSKIDIESLSEGQVKIIQDNNNGNNPLSTERLLFTLYPRKHFSIHADLLRFFVKHGCVLTKIWKGWKFVEKDQMASFIDRHIKERATEVDPIRRQVLKDTMNMCYGTTIRAVWNDCLVKAANNVHDALKLLAHPRLASLLNVDQDLTIFSIRPPSVTFKMLYLVEVAILQLSKLRMYQLWYEEIVPICRDRFVSIAMMDTDSFSLEFELKPGEKNVYHVLKRNWKIFDTSNYDPSHEFYCADRKNHPGLLKSDFTKEIRIYIGVCPKVYLIDVFGGGENKRRMKGVTKRLVRALEEKDYHRILFSQESRYFQMNLLCSKAQKLYLLTVSKRGAGALTLKNYFVDRLGLRTVPYGYNPLEVK